MLDIQFVRDNKELVQKSAEAKNIKVDIGKLLELDGQRRALLAEIEQLRMQRNEFSASVSPSASASPSAPPGKEDASSSINSSFSPSSGQVQKGKALKNQLSAKEAELVPIDRQYKQLLKGVPNIPLDDVPLGTSEANNIVSKKVGEPTKFDFEPKTHAQIGQAKGWIDKERAAKVTGARFAYIKGDLVKLQIALIEYVIDQLTNENVIKQIIKENGLQVNPKPFMPILTPLMIRTELYDAMDRLDPRDDRYKIEGEELWLQGSAEHVLGSMHADEVLSEEELPIRYLGYATSFRKEAGTYGKDMEGLFRLHQFDKLEMESLTTADNGLQEHLFLIAIQEYLMQQLKIPYQVLNKCTADIGKPNARGVDIEAWLPGQNKYRETHTADYMTDYQSRRLKMRVRRKDAQIELVHTNDATAFALSRTPIAIIENYQTANGDVVIPESLRPYLGGKETL